ncbi:Gfo/Idh/MocA family oxidoreductase [Microlunatus panaciterrae]
MNEQQKQTMTGLKLPGTGLRIGVMSYAHVHAPGLVSLLKALGAEVLAADLDPARGASSSAAAGVEFVGDYEALLARDLDGVVICAENSEHRKLTERAAAAGAYVLTEKPLATSVEDGLAMIDACDRAGVGLMTAFPLRFAPQIITVAALAHGGRLGKIAALSGANPGSCPGGWFADKDLAGGGCVMDHTVHLADLMCWLTGAIPTTVYAQTNRMISPQHNIDTGGLVSITFSDGTIANIDASWSRLGHYPVWGGLTLEVVGTDGVVQADPFGEQMLATSQQTKWLRFGADPNREMVREFLTSIRERRQPTPSGRDGLLATAIALAAYRSDEQNAPVAVDLGNSAHA